MKLRPTSGGAKAFIVEYVGWLIALGVLVGLEFLAAVALYFKRRRV